MQHTTHSVHKIKRSNLPLKPNQTDFEKDTRQSSSRFFIVSCVVSVTAMGTISRYGLPL